MLIQPDEEGFESVVSSGGGGGGEDGSFGDAEFLEVGAEGVCGREGGR